MLKRLLDLFRNESQSMKRCGLDYFFMFPATRREKELEDNKKIDDYINWLNREIELMHMEKTPVHIPFSEREYGMYSDLEYLESVFIEHSESFDFIIHNYKYLMHTVPKNKIDKYFELFKEFEKEVNRFDSTYPASLISSSDNS